MNWRSVVHHVIACPLSFQLKGKVSDIIPLDETRVVSSEKGSIWRFAQPTDIDYMNPTTVSKYSAITPVENINCPVMLVSGTDDLNVPTDFTVKFIIDRLKENGKEHLCTNLSYPQAGHVIEPPYSPLCDFFSKSTKEGLPLRSLGRGDCCACQSTRRLLAKDFTFSAKTSPTRHKE